MLHDFSPRSELYTVYTFQSLLSSVLLTLFHFASVLVVYSSIDLLFFDLAFLLLRIAVLNWGLFSPLGTVHDGGCRADIRWVEARDATNQAAVHRTFPE